MPFRLQCEVCHEKSEPVSQLPPTIAEELSIVSMFKAQHDRTCRAASFKAAQPLAQVGAFGAPKRAPKSVRKPHGHVELMGPYGERLELDTIQCVHCQRHMESRIGDPERYYCQNCGGYVCGPGCMECVPKERKLENVEAGLDPLTPGAPKILVPALLYSHTEFSDAIG